MILLEKTGAKKHYRTVTNCSDLLELRVFRE